VPLQSAVAGSAEKDLKLKTQATTTVEPGPSVSLSPVWRTIRGYIFWSYERGTLHYDVMVTLILFFVFLSPYWINFKDKPVERNPHRTGVAVLPDGEGGLIYQIDAKAIQGKNEAAIRTELLSIIEPISGEVSILRYEAERDRSGLIFAYKVWVQR
jgi:hypothetical protein